VAFDAPNFATPTELSVSQVAQLADDFIAAAGRAAQAGFEMIELHAAHGYLLHSFHSPISNRRTDQYGGPLENRVRLLRSVVQRLRGPSSPWPADHPIAVRISAVDDVDGGWSLEDSVQLARWLKADGVDLIDCSSGGISMQTCTVRTPREPGFQVPYAARVKAEAGIATAAVGGITQPDQAQAIINEGRADVTLLAREMLRDPFWPVHAAAALGVPGAVRLPPQYDFWVGPPKTA
jgi:2,4-dienoyl-CoA reductase-like NADH-dependent reductase (Old Yellow Enzyme family)